MTVVYWSARLAAASSAWCWVVFILGVAASRPNSRLRMFMTAWDGAGTASVIAALAFGSAAAIVAWAALP